MNVNPINNAYSNTNFGAKIKFENPIHRDTMTNVVYTEKAKDILDRFLEYHPKETVRIALETAYANPYNSCLKATNETTGVTFVRRLKPIDVMKNYNDESSKVGCCTLFDLLETLLDKSDLNHTSFWGIDTSSKPRIELAKHPVFDA